MCDPFDVNFTGDVGKLIAKAKTEIEAQDGTMEGDNTGGTINISLPIVGMIAGTYKVTGQVITIAISQKPQFVPCNMIETKIREALGN
jgi:hypothetical protein